MSANQIIKDHDKWRKGAGGAKAGLSGESDGDSYAGLDLDLITIASSRFDGSSFSSVTFKNANWSSSHFAGVRFTAPLAQQAVWDLANDYQDVGRITPGVTAVRYLERSETREVIQLDVKVLWKQLTLTFEVEKEPPRIMRFRLVNEALGEYRGISVFAQEEPEGGEGAPRTGVEMATWLKPNRPVPMGLLLLVERMAMLQAAREFLETCERSGGAAR